MDSSLPGRFPLGAHLDEAGGLRLTLTPQPELLHHGIVRASVLAYVIDAPGGEGEAPAGKEDYVIHAAVVGGDAVLMGSDDPFSDDFGPVQGMMVSYSASDADDAKRVFEAMADGGQVNQDLTETFFSPAFGMCVDRFGTPWMVSAEQAQEG